MKGLKPLNVWMALTMVLLLVSAIWLLADVVTGTSQVLVDRAFPLALGLFIGYQLCLYTNGAARDRS